ncbi:MULTISPECIES: hypothetical protein [Xanthomonas]|uniref:hypothetical protein n=1 Tax=Xanthomonas TaxID=338 RepID=UPI001ADCDFAA|nr:MULTISPECIES: hypothetical protein [unclassified Xanthomonas]MBO9873110.1 hypothetical protein [Xanthomonas sp. D-93]WNH44684.1 hypothetical protein PG878_19595 [Xanthomonas sp. A6251]
MHALAPSLPRRSLAVLAFAVLCIGGLCGFRPWPAPPASASAVQLQVIDRDAGDALLPAHAWRGERWIAATPGHRYALRLTNLTGARVLVVLSVDGVNAVSGQTAASDQRGYVLAPWQQTEITGWRKSSEDVAQFVFTDLEDSYAARTGRPRNVGVIGMAVFDEARAWPDDAVRDADIDTKRAAGTPARASATPAPSAAADIPQPSAAAPLAAAPSADARAYAREGNAAERVQQRLGTGHGAREWSPSRVTEFERASDVPMQRTALRYDSRARLIARGVLPRTLPPPRVAIAPDAFPGEYVPDPPTR